MHDVKNSLTAVIGNLHLMDVILSKLELSPEIRAELDAMLGDMEVSSRSALDTCGRLERLGSGKKTKLRVWLRELVDSTFELAKHPIRQSEALEKKRVVVVNRVPPQIALETVPQELQMAMLNIVLNSVKHGIPPGSRGTVSADASREDGHVDISISNDGVPIPPRLLPSLFKSPLSSDCESGLGLYISAMSIAELGGTISCISDAKGTEFKIRMPAH
ncbi:MAG: HAMP domain-containing sensor histidine kinase [Candidatus Micrarchaeota archaeon]